MLLRRAIAAIMLVAAAAAPAWAGVRARDALDLSRYEGRTVADVTVEMEGAVPDESAAAEMRARVRVAPGARFSAVRVRESLLELYASGRVADARVEAADAAGGPGEDGRPRVSLRFIIRPQVVVGGVEFEVGVTAGTEVTEDELRSRLTLLDPGRAATAQALRASADAIQVYLRDRGFYRAEVSYETRLDATRTRATVVFNIEPGPTTTVEDFRVNIDGFDPALVAGRLALRRGARFTQESLGEDVRRIREAIIETGHLAPRIDEPRITLAENNRITVELTGAVGPEVTVTVVGYEMSEERKRELLPVAREGTIDVSAVVEGARRIRNRLQEQGYFFPEFRAVCSTLPPLANGSAPPVLPLDNTGERGFEFSTCEGLPAAEELSDREVSIVYEVERGRRFTLTDIQVTGTDRLSEDDVADLKDDLRSREANVLGIIPLLGYGRGYTSADAIEQDRRTVEARMRELGYLGARVEVRQGVSLEGDGLILTFDVTEGPLTRVAGVEVRGSQIFTSREVSDERCPREPLPDEACLIVGGAYSRRQARADGERIRSFYARQGYVDADVGLAVVQLPPAPTGDQQVRLVYTVAEGRKVFVNRIYVNGLVHTKRDAVTDAIPLREGEVLRADDLSESERILVGQTGDAFRQVIIRTEAAGQNESGFPRRNVIIDVEERERIVMDYGGGFSTDNGPLGLFEIRNSNLFGELKQGALRSRASRRQQILRLEYFDPRFRRYGARDFSPLTISLQYTRDTNVTRFFRSTLDRGSQGIVQRFDSEGNIIDEFGERVDEPSINRFQVNVETQRDLELELGPRGEVRRRSTLFLRYNYEDVRLFNIGSLLLAPVLRPDQSVRLSRLGAAFARDTRDRQFDPTRGDFLTLDYALALKQLGGNLSFSKLLANYSRYYKLNRVRETVLAARVQVGLARLYSPPDRDENQIIDEVDRRLPISERFFSGGSTTLRGFGFEEAGPRIVAPECFITAAPANPAPCGAFRNEQGEVVPLNPFTVPIGGNALAVVNLEARVGLTRSVQAVPFYDGGNVFRRVKDIFRKCEPNPAAPAEQNACATWTHTVGFGLRVKTPLGPLAVDYGYLLNPPEFLVPQFGGAQATHRLRRTQLHFRFGQTF